MMTDWPECFRVGHPQSWIERTMALAKIGFWSCNLSDGSLNWTSGTYHLFGLPVGSVVTREQALAMYTQESRQILEKFRSEAITEGGTFALEAEIIRADGSSRWMKITGQVSLDPAGGAVLHGLKQDITQEKVRFEKLRRLAENDALTGVSSRAVYENNFLSQCGAGASIGAVGALILFDLDGFKAINDHYGHAAGDQCLREFAVRLRSSFPDALLTARIGGDEFAMIVGNGISIEAIQQKIDHFHTQLQVPILWQSHPITISVTSGMAVPSNPYFYDAQELFTQADEVLYKAKRSRNLRVKVMASY